MLFVWFVWDVFVDASARPTQDHYHLKATIPVYRAVGSLVALVWLWFANLTVFARARINHIALFDMDTRTSMDRRAVLREASTISVVFFANALFYFKALRRDGFQSIAPNNFPLLLCLYFVYKLFFPWEQRQRTWATILDCALAPFSALTFRHVYVGDVLTSMVKVLADMAYTACFFVSGEWSNAGMVTCSSRPFYVSVVIPLAHSLPLWFRFMQTIKQYRDTRSRWPYLGNAFKYAFAQSVILFGVFKPHLKTLGAERISVYQVIWILTFVCSTLYSFWWDVVMDWGLGNPDSGFLRDRLLFRRRWIYWLVMVADLGLRFLWTASLVPVDSMPLWLAQYMDYWMIAAMEVAELFRRAMWGCVRLEWEQIVQGGGLGAADIKLSMTMQERSPPLDGKRVVVEAAVFVASVVTVSAIAALS